MITEEQREEIIRKQARIEFLNRVMIGIAIGLIILFMTIMLVSIRVGQEQRAAILSCTVPSGACYQDAQARTKAAVKAIAEQNGFDESASRQISIYAVYCADKPQNDTHEKIEHCVKALLLTEGDHFHYPREGGP